MADQNAIVLTDIEPPPTDRAWQQATEGVRLRYYQHAADEALSLKLKELRKGIGVDGQKLHPVLPKYRPDGATGPPLSPHRPESRSQKWLRSSIGMKAGTITLWWSHGWGEILGYHARGEVIGAYLRDVIGLTAASRNALKLEMRRWWAAVNRNGGTAPAARRPPSRSTALVPPADRGLAARRPDMVPYLEQPPPPREPRNAAEALAATERLLGVTFRPHAGNGLVTVVIDLRKALPDLAADKGFFVGPGGKGGIPGRYDEFAGFLAKAKANGTPIEQPKVTVDAAGISVVDGRHRLAVMADRGAVFLPVSVAKSEAAALQTRYGVASRPGLRPSPRRPQPRG